MERNLGALRPRFGGLAEAEKLQFRRLHSDVQRRAARGKREKHLVVVPAVVRCRALMPGLFEVALKAIIVDDDRVLCLLRPSSQRPGMVWDLPGGRMDAGESLKEALSRELREELGDARLRRLGSPVGVSTHSSAHAQAKVLLYFHTDADVGEIELSGEHADYRWLTRAELERSEAIRDGSLSEELRSILLAALPA